MKASEFRKELFEFRIEQGITQRELAEKMGVTRVTVCDVERGARLPSKKFIAKFNLVKAKREK